MEVFDERRLTQMEALTYDELHKVVKECASMRDTATGRDLEQLNLTIAHAKHVLQRYNDEAAAMFEDGKDF